MYNVSDITNNDKYPGFIRNHPIFKEIKSYSKIFPRKGLENNSRPIKDYLAIVPAKLFIDNLLKLEIYHSLIDSNDYLTLLKDETFEALCIFFSKFSHQEYIDLKLDNKVYLHIPENIVIASGKTVFRKGMSLFSILEKLNLFKFKTYIVDCLSLQSFKDFGRLNIPLSSINIRFSSDPWDIATMSMRGITTCQNWSNEYRRCLIGSILDPYVGIIYLEKNKQDKYGSKMLFRSIVRFAIENGQKPVLIIDLIYPQRFKEVEGLFAEYLRSKSGLEVLYVNDISKDIINGKYLLPMSNLKNRLHFFNENEETKTRIYDDKKSICSYQNIVMNEIDFDPCLDVPDMQKSCQAVEA